MTVSASRSDHHVDVLERGEVEAAQRRPSRWAVVVAAGAAVALTAALAVPVVGDADWGEESVAPPVSLEGTLRLADFRSDSFGDQRGWGDGQERNARGSGTVLLELPDGQLRGAARIDFEASYSGDDAKGYFHSWGDIRLLVGSPAVACRGSFGWSSFQDPPEGGGSMHARCDDGAVLAATMVETAQLPGQGLTIDLRNGWYVAGSASAQAPDPRPGTLPQAGG